MKDLPRIVEAFSYYVQAFPDTPQASAAFAQRAVAYREDKNYDVALADLNTILTKYPGAAEREASLQQKALILGQQGNAKGMSTTFRQLLKEFPKTPAAAQAQYYIGKTAFEAKDYKAAIASLNTARQLNKEQYYDLATVRIVSSYFYLRDRAALTKEVDAFMAASPNANVPAEILEWLGIEYYNEKNYAAAEKYLSALGKIQNLPNNQVFVAMANVIGLQDWAAARGVPQAKSNQCLSNQKMIDHDRCCTMKAPSVASVSRSTTTTGSSVAVAAATTIARRSTMRTNGQTAIESGVS